MCLDPHLNKGWGWRRFTGLSPPVKYFTDRSKAVLLLWIFYVFVLSCVCYVLCASVYMCFVVTCWERADLLALVCGVFCEFVTFPLVSWVRCGTWLYRFLIFATLLLCSLYNSFSLYFLFSDAPVFRCFHFQFSPVFQCFCFQAVLWPCFQVYFVPVSKCFSFQISPVFKMFLFLSVPVFQRFCVIVSDQPVFRCSSFPAFLCFCFRCSVFRWSCFPVFLFLCSCCLNAEARRSRLCWLVLKLFDRGVISGRRPGIVWSIVTFRYALTRWDRTETPGIPRLVPLRQIGEKR